MSQIAITFADQPDGTVDIQVYLGDLVEGQPETPAQALAKAMLQAAKAQTDTRPEPDAPLELARPAITGSTTEPEN